MEATLFVGLLVTSFTGYVGSSPAGKFKRAKCIGGKIIILVGFAYSQP